MTESQDLYVPVRNPLEFRRHVLESSKSIIILLKDHHNLITLRKHKKALMQQLDGEVKEVTFLIGKVRELMPDKQFPTDHPLFKKFHDMQEKQRKQEQEKQPLPTKAPESVKTQEQKEPEHYEEPSSEQHEDEHDIAKLERALSSIEKKLERLG